MPVVDVSQYKKRKCQTGMIESYLRYAQPQESPTDFHLWTLISTISAALGRNCHVNMGMFSTYPNMYIILVGESAITHKSTAIKMGLKPFRSALPEVAQLSQKMSPEMLINTMKMIGEDETGSGNAEAFLESSELSNLLGQSKLDDSLLKILTEFWDSPDYFSYATLGRGTENVQNICLNLLGGSTPVWLRSSVPDTALEGGFFSRLILVHRPPKGERNPCPIVTPEQRDALESVKHDLRCIRDNMQGEFIVEEAAQQFFNEWYIDYNKPENAESYMRGYYGRKGDFVQKVAMCLSANYNDQMVITYDDMSLALKLLNENEEFAKETVKYMGTTEVGNKHVQVMNLIKRNTISVPPTEGVSHQDLKTGNFTGIVRKGIRHSDLLRRLSYKLPKDEIENAIAILRETGDISLTTLPPGNAKAYVWEAEGNDIFN